ncbi:hypothetical protein BGZ76_006794 [Entomortierella beljakovae]|nr:hypothetical protein BGZ76_006794 [Entomortierella beljakovae]
MPNVFSIPEITLEISRGLTSHDILQCILVNSTWFSNFYSQLWRTYRFIENPEDFDYDMDGPGINEFKSIELNNHLIRGLHTNSCSTAAHIFKNCNNLQFIHLRTNDSSLDNLTFLKNDFVPGMQRNQGLTTLAYNGAISSDYHLIPLASLKLILDPLRNLKHLYIHTLSVMGYEAIIYISKYATQLHSLRINAPLIPSHETSSADGKYNQGLDMTKLRCLEFFVNLRFGYGKDGLNNLLKASPHLERLALPLQYTVTSVSQTIHQNCPKIRHLALTTESMGALDDDLAALINSCHLSGLESFESIFSSDSAQSLGPYIGRESLKALLGHTATLSYVRISCNYGDICSIISQLLTQCPNLRVLDSSEGRYRCDDPLFPPLENFVIEPWVCSGLKVLRVPSAAVFGSQTAESERNMGNLADRIILNNNRTSNNKEPRHDNFVSSHYHKEIYKQLSGLKRLRELKIGSVLQRQNVIPAALRFSLTSRLDMLKELKMLRVLDVEGVGNEIGRKELEWMNEYWTDIESVKGIKMDVDKVDRNSNTYTINNLAPGVSRLLSLKGKMGGFTSYEGDPFDPYQQ